MNQPAAPRRVLQVIEATLGGTRRYLANMLDALGSGSHNGLAYSLDRADSGFFELLENCRKAGWMLYEIDMCRRMSFRRDLAAVWSLRGVYKAFSPSIIHAHSSKAGAIARLATLGMSRRPGIVYSPHSIGVNLGWIYRPIEQVLATRLDALSAVTPSERDELIALKLLAPSRVHVVVPAISSVDFTPLDQARARRDLHLGSGPLVIAVGRLTQQKDPLAFVDFVQSLKRLHSDVSAIWIGDGELRSEMESRISAFGLEGSVHITGWKEDVRPYIAACNLLVSTSAYESFGYVTAEALAMDRPVVASAITGTIDVVTTDVSAQLYPHLDIDGAATLAARLLSDQRRASEIAARGRNQVLKTFSVSEMRRGLDSVYAAAAQQ